MMDKYRLKHYLLDKKSFIFFFFMFFTIQTVILLIYSVSPEPLLYGFVLSFIIILVAGGIDYQKRLSSYQHLYTLLHQVHIEASTLPLVKDNLNIQYVKIINRLIMDQKELIQTNDLSKTEMIDYYTLWAHQIKTPIAAMGLLLQKDSTPSAKALHGQLFKIEQYVEMVLSYLRIESSDSDLIIGKYDLHTIVKQSIRKYAPLFISQRLPLELEDFDHVVITDEKWLVFIIEQLISNALKYTKEGSVSIYTLEKTSKEYETFFKLSHKDSQSVLVIKDTGIGISPQDLPRIFDKGYTGYNGRTDKKATGIGLYLTKKVATKLNHGIYVWSKENQGTTIFLDLDR